MEVSNKALHAYFDGVQSMGDSVDDFITNLPISKDNLLDNKGRITWGEFKLITKEFADRYPNYVEIISNTGISNSVVKPLFDILTFVISYKSLHSFFIKLTFKMLYSNIHIDSNKVSNNTFEIIFIFDKESQIFPEFINMYVGLFRTVPVSLLGGKTYSKVSYFISGNRVIFNVSNKEFSKFSIPNILSNISLSRNKYEELILRNIEYSNILEKQNLELESYRNDLELLNAELLLSNRTLDHDIANKLATLEIAKRRIKDGKYDMAIDKIDHFSKSVRGIIQNARFNKGDAKNLPYKLSSIDLLSALNEVLSEFEDLALQKNIKIIHDFKVGNGFKLLTNKIALQNNIISNLLNNAVKFSRSGESITFSVYLLDEQLIMKIVDTGVGIAEDKLCLIKSNSCNIQSSQGTDGEAGTGNGMNIVMGTAKSLGFNVNVTSSLNHGTSVELIKSVV